MYVRKFEADSLEEALKEIKQELGPDAIILKTVTNKGLKGAFKKKRIEITAAISEKNYTKKAQVDRVLDTTQKENFYSQQSSYVANMIDNYSANREEAAPKTYGGLGLNRPVSTVKQSQQAPAASSKPRAESSLDDFLNEEQKRPKEPTPVVTEQPIARPTQKDAEWEQSLRQYEHKVEELERQLFDLSKAMERLERREPEGLYQLRSTLKSLDIDEGYVQTLIKTSTFELSREELENPEVVFEFALKLMLEDVPVAMPMFSSMDQEENGVITILLSESSCGQTSMIQKIGSLKGESLMIQNRSAGSQEESFADKIFNLKTVYAKGIGEMVSECRKGIEAGQSVFIDYRCQLSEPNETKKFIEGLRRAFPHVEVLITLSAIHSELYNRKVMNRYATLSDGVVISHLDLCLNFGSVFNLGLAENRLPFKFFGTGEVIPDDIEAATAERILAGIFQIS